MAQYNGFVCDSCGKVIGAEERTKMTVRYEGKVVEGEFVQDKCQECLGPVPESLRPIRRRKKRATEPAT